MVTILDLDPIDGDFHVILIIKRHEPFNSRTLMCRIRIIPHGVLVLLAVHFEIEVPVTND